MRWFSLVLLGGGLIVTMGLHSTLFAQNYTTSLELERSTDGLRSWQSAPITAGMLNNGTLKIISTSNSTFFRMKIAVSESTPPPTVPSNMIAVAGGTLPMSSELAGTIVSTFMIGKYETTWAEWVEVRAWALSNGYTDLAGVGAGTIAAHPVHSVSWYDAIKWSNAKSEKEGLTPVYIVNNSIYKTGQGVPVINLSANGYRLPFEAEWEWAARGGVLSSGYKYSGSNDVNAVAWYWDNSNGAPVNLYLGYGTWPVGQKLPNELGIHDMSGNVNEWVWEEYGSTSRRYRGGELELFFKLWLSYLLRSRKSANAVYWECI